MTANNNKENSPLVSDQPSYDGSAAHHHEAKTPSAIQRRYCRRTVLTRHLFAALTQRMWDFAVVVLLTVIGPKTSYGLVASYGITVNLIVAFLSPGLGSRMDKANRLNAMIFVTITQNSCTMICAVSFLILLYAGWGPSYWQWHALVVGIHLFGGLNNLLFGLANVVLERDWVVVIAEEDDDWLRSITANLKSIDLCCDLVAPFSVSLLQIVSYEMVALFISGANVLMVFLQYTALHQIYHRIPSLEGSLSRRSSLIGDSLSGSGSIGTGSRLQSISLQSPTLSQEEQQQQQQQHASHPYQKPCLVKACQDVQNFFHHGRAYLRQKSLLPGLALAMLYLTVLSFHMVMISYLLMRGMNVRIIGIVSGVSSGLGVLGTLAYECTAAKVSTTVAGLIAIWSQTMCLTIAAAALWYQELWTDRADLGIGLFVGAVGLSRFGLYMFDVAAAQLFQHLVNEEERGVVGGFQRTLESLFELASFFLVLVMPRPTEFPILALISYLQTFGAALVFSVFACREKADDRDKGHFEPVLEVNEGNGGKESIASSQQNPKHPLLYERPATIMSVGSFSCHGRREDDSTHSRLTT